MSTTGNEDAAVVDSTQMSVKELKARIDQISADIDALKRSKSAEGHGTMSVEELKARIDEISPDIDVLSRSKSAAQRQLNSLRDPVARLPLEIASKIFVQCLLDLSLREPAPGEAPMLLLQVCHAWSDIAIFTTAL
ncbi:hypothetical protein C8R46DRAFT_1058971 [Mycena filopes]|nr:hypothetical protein C8R46DRAFT_1058971 [Mycena filopes]